VNEERTIDNLVRRIQGRCRFLRATNPERQLFEECIQALTDVSVQLAQAKTRWESNTFTPVGNRVVVTKIEGPDGETTEAADA